MTICLILCNLFSYPLIFDQLPSILPFLNASLISLVITIIIRMFILSFCYHPFLPRFHCYFHDFDAHNQFVFYLKSYLILTFMHLLLFIVNFYTFRFDCVIRSYFYFCWNIWIDCTVIFQLHIFKYFFTPPLQITMYIINCLLLLSLRIKRWHVEIKTKK